VCPYVGEMCQSSTCVCGDLCNYGGIGYCCPTNQFCDGNGGCL
jgi:hypothetical protein